MIPLYESLAGIRKLTDEEKNKLVNLDRRYGEFVNIYRSNRDHKTVSNLDDEFKKFMKFRKMGVKYFPIIKCPGAKYDENMLKMGKDLVTEFSKFNCFLSRYYISIISKLVGDMEFFMGKRSVQWFTTTNAQTPSMIDFNKALEAVKQNPYDNSGKEDRDLNAKEAKKLIQAHIDDMGYKWSVEIVDDLLPRMSVSPYKKMFIKRSAKFSKVDIEGLCAHEVDGHIGRRYYGLKTGLRLFQHGLFGRNTLDEGLAIYNSLHKVNKVKPNVMFNIALKTILVYKCNELDFCELFDYCKGFSGEMPDLSLFTAIIRLKASLEDTSIMGANGEDQNYFCGYQIVKTLTDAQRDDILKYNIGPGQLADLDDIKKFLSLNKFKPLI